MTTRFHRSATGKPDIIDGRYYIALREPPMVVAVQPDKGFQDAAGAQQFLRTLSERSNADSSKYTIAEAAQIDTEEA